MYTNDHFIPLSNQYNPLKLHGRSCLFHYSKLQSSACFRVVFFWLCLLNEAKFLSSLSSFSNFLLIHSEVNFFWAKSKHHLRSLISCMQTLLQNLKVQLQSFGAKFYDEAKSPTTHKSRAASAPNLPNVFDPSKLLCISSQRKILL